MVTGPSPSANPVVCPSCGRAQTENLGKCSQCGKPLHPSGFIYRREADGTWSMVKDIDLSALAPRPPRVRRKVISRKGAVILLGVILLGAALDVWCWRVRTRQTDLETAATAEYLAHPIGRIVPRFELQYQRGGSGDLQISGRSNLPEGTTLEVQVYADDLLVAVDYPVTISAGAFQTRPLLERGKPFTAASYRVHIRSTFEKRWQPPAVLLVVGGLGERLEASFVRRPQRFAGARLDFAAEFILE
jgi:hypothetical protein